MFGPFFVTLVPFEILSDYPNIDSSHWLREDVQWIAEKIFGEKFKSKMASTLSSRTFLLKFWTLHVFVVFS